MARRTEKTKNDKPMNHPYKKYMALKAWSVIDKEIDSLVNNGDLKEETQRAYIVGSLCHALVRADLFTECKRHAERRLTRITEGSETS